MDYKSALSKIDEVVAAPTTRPMTKAEFGTYVDGEIAKAKKDKEAGKGDAANKRLGHLRKTVEAVEKANMWEGDNGTAAIPVYNEPGMTNDSELTETETSLTSVHSGASNADGTSGAGGAPAAFGKAVNALKKSVDAAVNGAPAAETPAPQGDGGAGGDFPWPSDMNEKSFKETGIAKRGDGGEWGRDSDAVK